MAKNRVYIIGASGTGKTTLAKALAAKLQCPHFDSDDFYHYPTDPPYLKQRSPEERAYLLSEALRPHSSWVLSGGAGTWQPVVDMNFTAAVFLYLAPEIRLTRLQKRESHLYGPRILAGGDMEAIHKEFIRWTQGYDNGSTEGTNSLPAHEDFISKVKLPVLRLDAPLTIGEQIDLILKMIAFK